MSDRSGSKKVFVDLLPAAIYTQEHGADRLAYLSPQVERMFGHSAAEWLATPGFWRDRLHPDDREMVEAEDARATRSQARFQVEYRFRRADGSYTWVRDEAELVRDEGGNPLVWQGFVLDIDERKRTEEQLQETEARYRELVELNPAVTYREVVSDEGWEDSIVYVSPRIEALLGYSPQEWSTDPGFWRRLVHPDDLEWIDREGLACVESGAPWRAEYRMLHRDGRIVWVHDESILVRDAQDRPKFWQGFLLDITDRKKTEAQLERAQTRYRALVEQVPAVMYTQVIDPDDPDVSNTVFISPQNERLIGYTVEEIMDHPTLWRDVLHPDDRERVLAADAASNRSGNTFSMEYRMLHKDGSVVWIKDDAALIRNEHGKALFWQGFMTDITDRKEAEARLQHALEVERKAAQRLRSLDDMKNTFLQAVSHDLRTPLAAILGLAVTLERSDLELDPVESRGLARRIASNARKLDRLVRDLLDLDRLSRGIVEPQRHRTNIGSLVRRTVADSDLIAEHDVVVECDDVVMDVDAPKVERIVENLVANTARHTPAGTTVWVRVVGEPEGVLLAVEDDGPGVAAVDRDRIFKPFHQGFDTSGHSPGVGVGLTLVERFAALHGGRAWVEERDGGGASFRVFLPRPAQADDLESESAAS